VANTYNYTQTEWKADVVAASEIGIDGFGAYVECPHVYCWRSTSPFRGAIRNTDNYPALNWGPPDCSLAPNNQDWYVARIEDAFAVAATNDFKLIYSFDMSYTPTACAIGWNTTFMATMISKYANSPAAYIWNGDVLVSSYGGEGYGNNFFAELKSVLAGEGVTISLSPALTTYSLTAQGAGSNANGVATGMLANYTAIDGYLNCMLLTFVTVRKFTYLMRRARANLASRHGYEPYCRRRRRLSGSLRERGENRTIHHG